MRLCLRLALPALVLAATACRASGTAKPPAASPFEALEYRDGPVSPDTKVFLVAGGNDVANFAAEILEQRALWRSAGLRNEEIACYYAKPSKQGWSEDFEQYQSVIEDLAGCFAADPARLQNDLRVVARAAPPWVYLYVTSHGVRSIVDLADSGADARAAQRLGAAERHELDTHAVALDAGPTPRLGELSDLVAARREGVALHQLVLTPGTLREALEVFPSDTEKIVVLQACYSGGFVGHDPPAGEPQASPLDGISNLVVLTAAAASRPSFGCGAGSHRTYFGGAYNRALARAFEDGEVVPALDWKRIYQRAEFAVEAMEAVDAERPSLPGFYTSTPSDSHQCAATCVEQR